MPNPWLRLYFEFADDPKVQMLSEAMQRRLVMLFCNQCKEEKLTDIERAFHWRLTLEELEKTKAIFIDRGFIEENWNLINWNRRQFLSDSSTERVRKHRAMKRDETRETKCNILEVFHPTCESPTVERSGTAGNVTVTAPDTEADTDTEKDISDAKASSLDFIEQSPSVKPDAVAIWNAATKGKLPHAKNTTKRQTIIRTRLKEPGWLEDFEKACAFLSESSWHQGSNDSHWVATLDYALQAGKATELAEKATQPRQENSHGTNKPSPTQQRVDNNRRALAEAVASRGIDPAFLARRSNAGSVLDSGHRSVDRGLPLGLRATGPELLPPSSHRSTGGAQDQTRSELFSTAR